MLYGVWRLQCALVGRQGKCAPGGWNDPFFIVPSWRGLRGVFWFDFSFVRRPGKFLAFVCVLNMLSSTGFKARGAQVALGSTSSSAAALVLDCFVASVLLSVLGAMLN